MCIRDRVGKAPVISTCGYLDGNGVVNNNVAGGGAAVCIYGKMCIRDRPSGSYAM